VSEMWKWIGLIAGIILCLLSCIPAGYEAPPPDTIETVTTITEVDELLEDWDLQDHLDELEDEEE